MPLNLQFDECLRDKRLWSAVQMHNDAGHSPVDVLRVGDPGAPAFETTDSMLLEWASENDRVIVSQDCNTLPEHLEEIVADGSHSPGIIFVQKGRTFFDLVDALSIVCHCCAPVEIAKSCIWLPR